MKTREFALALYSLFILSTCLVANAEDKQNTHGTAGSERAARSFSTGGKGFSGYLKRVTNDEGLPSLALVPQSGERYFLELGSDSELKSRLEGLLTESGQRDPQKIFVVDLVGEVVRKGDGYALKRVSIEFPENDDEIAAARRSFNGSYNINLVSPGIFSDQLAVFLKRLREVVPDVNIGITVDNGQPYSGRRYLAVQISSDYSRSYLERIMAAEFKSVVSSVEKTPARAINLKPILARP